MRHYHALVVVVGLLTLCLVGEGIRELKAQLTLTTVTRALAAPTGP